MRFEEWFGPLTVQERVDVITGARWGVHAVGPPDDVIVARLNAMAQKGGGHAPGGR
jgi:hypothetical protein